VPLAASSGGSSALPLLFVVVIIAGMYFLMIRPQQRRAREQQSMQATLGPGDEVMTSSGIYGEIVEIDEADGSVLLEVAEDVVVKFARGAIVRTVTKAAHEDDEPEDEVDADEAEEGETEHPNPQAADGRVTGAESVIERRKD
jgi:preprotein translocase subunit YajC